MAKITILGGTGYTGRYLAEVAVKRGHEVTSVSRSAAEQPVDGVTYTFGSLLDDAERADVVQGADVIIASLSPRGELEKDLPRVYHDIAQHAAAANVRFGVIGGFSALRAETGAPRIAYTGQVPPEFAPETLTMAEMVDWLIKEAPENLDWFYVSPAAVYGSFAPGEEVGTFRIGGDVVLPSDGPLAISGADFASAVIDEVETPAHRNAHFAVAY